MIDMQFDHPAGTDFDVLDLRAAGNDDLSAGTDFGVAGRTERFDGHDAAVGDDGSTGGSPDRDNHTVVAAGCEHGAVDDRAAGDQRAGTVNLYIHGFITVVSFVA